MNTFRFSAALLLLCLLTLSAAGVAQHQPGPKVYEEFHDVLHPLEHEALPNKDYRRIRSQTAELVKRGKAIVKTGTPEALAGDRRTEFIAEMKMFDSALNKLKSVARRGSNTRLTSAYSAVHDSFEKLMHMLPSR